jgi:YHS domain-containing protein
VGLVPAHRPGRVVGDTLRWDATTVADLVALATLAGVWWLARRRTNERPEEQAYAIDPVCGMQVEKALAPARAGVGGVDFWFCSEGCRDAFVSRSVASPVSEARGG